jgi:hypothetical protein
MTGASISLPLKGAVSGPGKAIMAAIITTAETSAMSVEVPMRPLNLSFIPLALKAGMYRVKVKGMPNETIIPARSTSVMPRA